MTDDQTVDKDKFDALLQKLIKAKPISNEEIAAKSKAGKPKNLFKNCSGWREL